VWPAISNLAYATPNGGNRNIVTAVKLKREGVKAGVPDIFIPVPVGGYHGLYIEMKRVGGRKPTGDQKDVIMDLEGQGFLVAVCYGWQEAVNVVEGYVDGKSAQKEED